MKKSGQKIMLIALVIISALCAFFIYQWNEERNQSKGLNTVKERMLFSNLSELADELDQVSGTLQNFQNNFSQTEWDLYHSSIYKDVHHLNEVGTDLDYLINEHEVLIYEQYIWVIQNVLSDIKDQKITSEEDIHELGRVIKDQSIKLSNMMFEERISVNGLTKEEVQRITNVLDAINAQIKKIEQN